MRRRGSTIAVLGLVVTLAIGGCAAAPGTGDGPTPTPWIPYDPSYGAPLYPGAEYMPTEGREAGEYSRTWWSVAGGQSYCSSREEFAVVEGTFDDVVAWYRTAPGADREGPDGSEGVIFVFQEDAASAVFVDISRAKSIAAFLEFELREYLADPEGCKTTFVVHDD